MFLTSELDTIPPGHAVYADFPSGAGNTAAQVKALLPITQSVLPTMLWQTAHHLRRPFLSFFFLPHAPAEVIQTQIPFLFRLYLAVLSDMVYSAALDTSSLDTLLTAKARRADSPCKSAANNVRAVHRREDWSNPAVLFSGSGACSALAITRTIGRKRAGCATVCTSCNVRHQSRTRPPVASIATLCSALCLEPEERCLPQRPAGVSLALTDF